MTMKAEDSKFIALEVVSESGMLGLLQPLCIGRDFSLAATEFVSRLASAFACERVSLGFVDDDVVKIYAVSHFHQRLTDAMLPELRAAMQESVLQDLVLVYPQPPSDFPCISLAHARLVQINGLACAVTVPFGQDGKVVGALTFERLAGETFGAERLAALTRLVSLVGPLLELKWSLALPAYAKGRRRLREYLSAARDDSRAYRRLAIALPMVLLAAAFFAVPVSHQVAGQARLEALTQRLLSAAVDGYLKEVRVRPGDQVQARQLLAELNDEALRTEHRRLEAEAAQQENSLAEAMVKADRTQVVVRRAKLDEIVAQRDLVNQQLNLIRLVAPFDGVVIKGDLMQLLGSPIKRGDVLLTLSQGAEFRVLVEVPERDIADIETGQRGHLMLTALPAEKFAIRITRIPPVATVGTDGQNVFEVEATIEDKAAKLVPGLKGAAKITTGDKPVGWKWTLRAWNTLSFFIWSRT